MEYPKCPQMGDHVSQFMVAHRQVHAFISIPFHLCGGISEQGDLARDICNVTFVQSHVIHFS